jgi:hypothetical protein
MDTRLIFSQNPAAHKRRNFGVVFRELIDFV